MTKDFMRMNINKHYSSLYRGFTIVELIVVIAIMGILLSVAVIGLSDSQNRSKKDAAVASAEQVKLKLAGYFQDRNRYPQAQGDVVTYLGTINASTLGTTFSNTSEYNYSATRADGTACVTNGTPKCDIYTITVKKTWWNGSSTDNDVLITP